jgi:hypothetical protein
MPSSNDVIGRNRGRDPAIALAHCGGEPVLWTEDKMASLR